MYIVWPLHCIFNVLCSLTVRRFELLDEIISVHWHERHKINCDNNRSAKTIQVVHAILFLWLQNHQFIFLCNFSLYRCVCLVHVSHCQTIALQYRLKTAPEKQEKKKNKISDKITTMIFNGRLLFLHSFGVHCFGFRLNYLKLPSIQFSYFGNDEKIIIIISQNQCKCYTIGL